MLKMIARILVCVMPVLSSCGGYGPSSLLRQGQMPIQDFPMYMTEGAAGIVWRVNRDRSKEQMLSGLSDPRGIATDKFGNLYIAEYGAGQVVKVKIEDKSASVIKSGLNGPSMVAVDSVGEVYVAEDVSMSISRVSDGKVVAAFASLPSAMAFGVNDGLIVGLYNENVVKWLQSGNTATVERPVAISIDGTGRVYVTKGGVDGGEVHRFHQTQGDSDTLVAKNLQGPLGTVIDPAGNLFIAEQGASRMVLQNWRGEYFSWLSDLTDVQYMAFSNY